MTTPRIYDDPEARQESAALLRKALLRHRCNIPRAVLLTGFPREVITAWTHQTDPETIPPENMLALMESLDLTDDEAEDLLACSLREHRPYWCLDDIQVEHGWEQTLDEVAVQLDYTRQRVNQIEIDARKKLEAPLRALGFDNFMSSGRGSLWDEMGTGDEDTGG